MLSPRTALVPLALLLLVGVGAKEEITFHVAAGTTLARTVEIQYQVALEDFAMTMDGEEVPAEYLGEMHFEIKHHERYVVTDLFEAMAGGRPARLKRTFDELTGKDGTRYSSGVGEENDDKDYESVLEKKSVVFTWNEDSGGFEVAYGEGIDGDEERLAKLEEDMDLRVLLPAAAVEEGESWELDAREFRVILDPGGDLALEDTESDEDTSNEDEQLRANLTGKIRATYKGTRVEEGSKLATIALAVEAETHAEDETSADEVPEGGHGTSRTEVGFNLEGELLWDLEHGHARSFELSGANEVTMIQSLSGEFEGESFEQAQTMSLVGEVRFTMQVER